MQFYPAEPEFKWQDAALKDEQGRTYEVLEGDYIRFGDVALHLLRQQCQYASRLINGLGRRDPELGKGLRFVHLDAPSYHEIGIHVDDVDEFVRRVRDYRKVVQGGFVNDEGKPEAVNVDERRAAYERLSELGVFANMDSNPILDFRTKEEKKAS